MYYRIGLICFLPCECGWLEQPKLLKCFDSTRPGGCELFAYRCRKCGRQTEIVGTKLAALNRWNRREWLEVSTRKYKKKWYQKLLDWIR